MCCYYGNVNLEETKPIYKTVQNVLTLQFVSPWWPGNISQP